MLNRPAEFEEGDDVVDFIRRRHAPIQRSQDSGAMTDWSGSRGSPTRQSCDSNGSLEHKYVTVLSVNGGLDEQKPLNPSDFVTVVSIGDDAPDGLLMLSTISGVCLSSSGFVEEVARVGRKPGQKLGFGLKFDGGGSDAERPIQRLFIQCCAEASPAASVRCSWGKLVEADEIVEIDGVDIRDALTRLQVVRKLTDGPDVLSLKIRHYWDADQRLAIIQKLNAQTPEGSSRRSRQERAVDVPQEFLIKSGLEEDGPPPVPPRRRRRSKATGQKPIVTRSLSSDEMLAVKVAIPSKPPRNRLHQSRSFNSGSQFQHAEVSQSLATLPRTGHKELAAPPPAEVYVNLIAEEDKRMSSTESESDASSSVSTVIDRDGPFCDEEPEEQQKMVAFIKEATLMTSSELEIVADPSLAVLIQPPETFLDQSEPTSISPKSDCDSGASSGGSQLHLSESDEELRAFQQVECALEMGVEDKDAILLVKMEANADAICCEPSEPAKIAQSGIRKPAVVINKGVQQATKVEQNAKSATCRSSLNRTPLRSRIPQAVSSSPTRTAVTKGVVAAPAAHNKPARPVKTSSSHQLAVRKATPTTHSKPVAQHLLKSAKPGLLPVASSPGTSKIPRPNALASGQPLSSKSSSTVASARPLTATSRHSSLSLLPGRTAAAGKNSTVAHHKSTSRLHLTHHNNKGESHRSADLVSAH